VAEQPKAGPQSPLEILHNHTGRHLQRCRGKGNGVGVQVSRIDTILCRANSDTRPLAPRQQSNAARARADSVFVDSFGLRQIDREGHRLHPLALPAADRPDRVQAQTAARRTRSLVQGGNPGNPASRVRITGNSVVCQRGNPGNPSNPRSIEDAALVARCLGDRRLTDPISPNATVFRCRREPRERFRLRPVTLRMRSLTLGRCS
jgi:hypothetical protein